MNAPTSMNVEDATKPTENGGSESEMSFDPSMAKGLEKYQEGDRVSCKVDGTLGPVDEDGRQTIKIDRIEAEAMEPAKQASRAMMNKKPDMAGTAMEGQGGY